MDRWAKERGGECLSSVYVNQYTPLKWRCARGHEWSARPSNIKGGSWCARCVQVKGSLADMIALAFSRGGKFLSSVFTGVREKYEWECERGHRWSARAIQIKRGSWCGVCSSSGIGEEICRSYFEQLFGQSFPRVRPQWLMNPKTKRPLELDGYCEPLRLAFEHNGRQHYSESDRFAKGDKLSYVMWKDKLKLELCNQRNVVLIVIPEIGRATSLERLRSVIRQRCIEGGVLLPPAFDKCAVNLSDVSNGRKAGALRLNVLRRTAELKGGRLLSTTYLGSSLRLLWECHAGHQWMATPTHVKNQDSWCPQCWSSVNGRRDDQGKRLRRLVSTRTR